MPTDDKADNGISDEVLAQAQDYIHERLKSKRISADKRAELEIWGYFFTIMIQDHARMNNIYPYIKEIKAKEQRSKEWWGRFQWVVIPMGVTALLGIITQVVYFWIDIAPKLHSLP